MTAVEAASVPAPGFATGADGYAPTSPFSRVWTLIEGVLARTETLAEREVIQRAYAILCGESLRHPPDPNVRASVITRIGLPAEFSFTTDEGLGSFRFLTEVAPASARLPERFAATLRALDQLREVCGLTADRAAVRSIIQNLFPERLEPMDANWHNGAMWVAVRFATGSPAAVRVYANQQVNDNRYRFGKLDRLFAARGQEHNRKSLAVIADLSAGWADVVGVSFDQYGPHVGGIKLYLGALAFDDGTLTRLLDFLGLRDQQPTIRTFLSAMRVEFGTMKGPALLCSIPFPDDAHDRTPSSLKLDVTTPVTFENDAQVHEAVDQLMYTFRRHCVGLRACGDLFLKGDLSHGPVRRLQYVGLTASRKEPRLNLYLAPPTEGDYQPATAVHRPVDEPVRGRIARAFRALAERQSPDGGWWDLPMSAGASGPWLTAVVADAIRATAAVVDGLEAEPVLAAATRALVRAERADGGWAWNEALPPDCDSTAHALYFLAKRGVNCRASSAACLRQFQDASGAFLTYAGAPAGHSWGTPHHDVHPAAVRAVALLDGVDAPAVSSGVRLMMAALDQRPIWPAFWWTATMYGSYVALSCLSALGRIGDISRERRDELDRQLSAETDLELALSLMVRQMLGDGPGPRADITQLAKRQTQDGSWQGSRALRVVLPGRHRPWLHGSSVEAGPLYQDHRGVFATAMAMRALGNALVP